MFNTVKVETFVTTYRPDADGGRDILDQDSDLDTYDGADGDLVTLVLDALERQGVQFRMVNSQPHITANSDGTKSVRAASADPSSHPHTGVIEDVCVEVTGHPRFITALVNRPHWVNQ
jgi:hypothetical protein